MIRRDKDICRIWDIVCGDHPHQNTDWHISTTRALYSAEHKEPLHASEIMEALEARENDK